MKPQTPATGIMLDRNWGDARSYTIACECGGRDHYPQMWIEVGSEEDADLQNVTVTFYVETASPWYRLSRWRQIWTMLTRGHCPGKLSWEFEASFAPCHAQSDNTKGRTEA